MSPRSKSGKVPSQSASPSLEPARGGEPTWALDKTSSSNSKSSSSPKSSSSQQNPAKQSNTQSGLFDPASWAVEPPAQDPVKQTAKARHNIDKQDSDKQDTDKQDKDEQDREAPFDPPVPAFAQKKQVEKSGLSSAISPDIGLIGLLLLTLASGIAIGSLIVQSAQNEAAREARFKEQSPQLAIRMSISNREIKEYKYKYYEENVLAHPEDHRPDLNRAPQAALAALAGKTGPDKDSQNSTRQNDPSQNAPLAERSQDLPPWLRFAANGPLVAPDVGLIAIIIDDIGLDKPRSYKAINLPAPVTLAVLPYGDNLPPMVEEARRKGHEIMLHLPMEPLGRSADPGPNALLSSLSPEEIRRRLFWNLNQFQSYVGVNNHMGSRFTSHAELLRPVLEEIDRRGLLFVDSITSSKTTGYRLASELGLPFAVRDVFLDNELNPAYIQKQLKEVEETARRKGFAVAIGHPHDVTIDVLDSWIKELPDRGLALAPITTIIKWLSDQKNQKTGSPLALIDR